jgi:hypothetical protein
MPMVTSATYHVYGSTQNVKKFQKYQNFDMIDKTIHWKALEEHSFYGRMDGFIVREVINFLKFSQNVPSSKVKLRTA